MIVHVRRVLAALHRDEAGGALVEYALFAALVSVPAYLALQTLGTALQALFVASCTGLTNNALAPK